LTIDDLRLTNSDLCQASGPIVNRRSSIVNQVNFSFKYARAIADEIPKPEGCPMSATAWLSAPNQIGGGGAGGEQKVSGFGFPVSGLDCRMRPDQKPETRNQKHFSLLAPLNG
jgi:hypothetical protein